MNLSQTLLAAAAFAALAAPAAASPWQHYSDATLGWSISYPQGWKADPNYVSPAHGIHGVSFTIADSVQPGTNLSHNNTAISVENLPGKDCKPSQFVDPADHVHKLRADGRTYLAADSEDAGAGNFYETRIFVIPGTSPCLAVRYLIHSTNIGAYDPGTIKAFNEKKLVRMFDAIRASLILTK